MELLFPYFTGHENPVQYYDDSTSEYLKLLIDDLRLYISWVKLSLTASEDYDDEETDYSQEPQEVISQDYIDSLSMQFIMYINPFEIFYSLHVMFVFLCRESKDWNNYWKGSQIS